MKGHCLSKKKLLRTVTNYDALGKLDKVYSTGTGFQEALYVGELAVTFIRETLDRHTY